MASAIQVCFDTFIYRNARNQIHADFKKRLKEFLLRLTQFCQEVLTIKVTSCALVASQAGGKKRIQKLNPNINKNDL